jgi:arylsulfatase A-like enzyme
VLPIAMPTYLACVLVAAAALGGCARAPQRPNVLLVTIDTLRADHLGCYGYERDTSPNIDALAAESLRFTRAGSPRAKTTPAIASLFTGLYPHGHGVRDLLKPLAPDVPLLAESLRRAGYKSGAVIGNWVLNRERAGLERGFDLWVEYLPDVRGVPPNDAPQRTARSLSDAALVALGLAAPPDEPAFEPRAPLVEDEHAWFLWLHYMDPHGAYEPPADARLWKSESVERLPPPPGPDEAPGNPPHPLRVAEYNVPPEARLEDGGIDVARVRDLYDGEIRYVDRELGRVLDALRAAGTLDDTLVIVTADHGESLGEHRYWFEHGMYAYESTCRVPLIVRLPAKDGVRPASGVRTGAISLTDLAPTLLDVLDLPPLAYRQPAQLRGPRGSSQGRLWEADRPAERHIFAEKVERAGHTGVVQSKAVRWVDWKLIRRFAARERPGSAGERELVLLSEELFDLSVDPLESNNLIGSVRIPSKGPSDAPLQTLRSALDVFTDADVDLSRLDSILQQERERLERTDPEALRRLEALGY